MGKSKSSESKSYSGSGQPWATPFARAGIQQVMTAYERGIPYLDEALQGIGTLNKQIVGDYGAGQEVAAQGRQYYGDILSGKYMQGNPYLEQMISRTREGVADGVNSQFTLGGRYGSGAHAGMLTKEMANAENAMRFNNYALESGRMDQAAGAGQAANANLAGQAMGGYGALASMPWGGMNSLGNALGALMSGGSARSVSYAPSPIWGAIGSGLGALGAAASGGAFSDRRLKTKIEAIGKNEKGLTVYRYAYKSHPDETHTGFMADEVKKIVPEAYLPNFLKSGYDGVNYALTGSLKVVESA